MKSGPTKTRAVGAVTTQRLIIYYAALALVVGSVQWVMPARVAPPSPPELTDLPGALTRLAELQGSVQLPSWSLAVLLSVLAVLMALPFSMVYVRTRTNETYDRSLVHSVLALPLITTSIVVVVRDSLSLAFSLAGIVAAVRFRSNLKESRDAIYIFAAIGIGFAAGVEALPVALGLSVCFCLLELWQWKYGIGAEHDSTHRLLCGPPLDLQASLQAFDLPPATIAQTVARAEAGAPVVRVAAAEAPAEPPVPKVRVRFRLDDAVRGPAALNEALTEIVKKFTVIDVPTIASPVITLMLRPKRKLQGSDLHAALSRIGGAHLQTFEPIPPEIVPLRVAPMLAPPADGPPAFQTPMGPPRPSQTTPGSALHLPADER